MRISSEVGLISFPQAKTSRPISFMLDSNEWHSIIQTVLSNVVQASCPMKKGIKQMKRHHLAAGFCIIFGGISSYERFLNEDINNAIRVGMLFVVLGVILLFYSALRRWIKPFVIAVPVVLMGIVVYQSFRDGDLTWGILGIMVLILGGVLTVFQDRALVKERIRPWLRPIPFVALGILLIGALLSLV